MAMCKLVMQIKIKKWARPLVYFCAICGIKIPRLCFSFEVQSK